MGSTSPSLSTLPPGRLLLSPNMVLRAGPEKVTAGVAGPERRDWSPSPPATPEQGLSAFYLSCLDMLYPDDSSWATKGPGASARDEPPEEPEQCPVIDSQAAGSSLDLAPGGLTLEEHSLEQVQSMVVGEVLKDIETACKLLNITAGEPRARRSTSTQALRPRWGGRPGPASAAPGAPVRLPAHAGPRHSHTAVSRGWLALTLCAQLHQPESLLGRCRVKRSRALRRQPTDLLSDSPPLSPQPHSPLAFPQHTPQDQPSSRPSP